MQVVENDYFKKKKDISSYFDTFFIHVVCKYVGSIHESYG